ncbi:MAG: hypothetical protein IT428_32000 [Planctomycetaceae bacterium]|nr:hypothetical protein [Planctomycetaceae bacterium]
MAHETLRVRIRQVILHGRRGPIGAVTQPGVNHALWNGGVNTKGLEEVAERVDRVAIAVEP